MTDSNSTETEIPEKPLSEMTRAELFEMADELKIKGRHDMNKAQLHEAVEEALTAPAADGDEPTGDDAGQGAAEGDAGDAEPEVIEADGEQGDGTDATATNAAATASTERAELEARLLREGAERERLEREREEQEAEARRVSAAEAQAQARREKEEARRVAHANGLLTEEDRLAIMRGETDGLTEVLQDPQLPAFIAQAIRAELEARALRQKAADNRKLQRSPGKQFRVTGGPAGMRYVTKEAYVTTLPIGSVLTPLSYDLQHVADQGFTWEVIAGIEVSQDQLGNQVSTAK